VSRGGRVLTFINGPGLERRPRCLGRHSKASMAGSLSGPGAHKRVDEIALESAVQVACVRTKLVCDRIGATRERVRELSHGLDG